MMHDRLRNSLPIMPSSVLLGLTLVTNPGCVVKIDGQLDAGADDLYETDEGDDESMSDGSSEEADTSSDEADTSSDGPDTDDEESGDTSEPLCANGLDVLFVVDNSGSMGNRQARLAAVAGQMIDLLEEVGFDWRIGVTTTDNGNIWCAAGATTPEAGKLQLSSCRSRLDEFVLVGATLDVTQEACLDVCEYEGNIATLPTSVAGDPTPKSRPWIERIDGQLNLADGLTAQQAAPCLLPQGVTGCGFEQPLESMYLAMQRSVTMGESNFGFIRDDANLLVVLLTDEEDCSYQSDFADIFDPDGDRVFWSDPNSAVPTSAICWNAGVECTGEGPEFDACVAAHKGVDGQPTSPDQAVMHPTSRYADFLAAVQDSKAETGGEVRFLAIDGIGLDSQLHYADVSATDPDFQNSFGIGPGCVEDDDAWAIPPVRVTAVGESLGVPFAHHSICDSSYDEIVDAVYGALPTCEI